jgi:hypothetical protein
MKAKESMRLQGLQKLAEKVQLKIKSEEVGYLLDSLSKLEKLLTDFRQLKLEKSYQKLTKITLKDLRQLVEKLSIQVTKQETILHNATISAKSFLVIRKKKLTNIE